MREEDIWANPTTSQAGEREDITNQPPKHASFTMDGSRTQQKQQLQHRVDGQTLRNFASLYYVAVVQLLSRARFADDAYDESTQSSLPPFNVTSGHLPQRTKKSCKLDTLHCRNRHRRNRRCVCVCVLLRTKLIMHAPKNYTARAPLDSPTLPSAAPQLAK